MSVSKNNKLVTIKLSKDSYEYVSLFSKRFGCSVSSFIQDCVVDRILTLDSNALHSGNPTLYYQNLANKIKNIYDDRRKK